ncbi:MAG: hypothetical protein ACREJS_02310 [Candidatus Rokuibacteriota bacterium]
MPRFYERDATGAIVERPLPELVEAPRPNVRLRSVTEQQIKTKLQLTGAIRAAALADVMHAPVASRLVPEDLTRRAHVLHVAVGNYTDAGFADLAARVGQLEGFSVVVRVAPGSEWAEYLSHTPGLVVITLPARQYTWTEDVTEIGLDGTFHMTARMGNRGLLRRSLFIDRMRRFYPDLTPTDLRRINELPEVQDRPPGELPAHVMRRYPDILFDIQGLVERDAAQQVGAAMAAARGAELREGMTYLEGGNVLVGRLPSGEPHVLVGRDSAAVAATVLAHHLGRPVSEAEVIAAMAKDLGADPRHVVLVEQPGVFHLDLAMTLLAPGTVVLNDAFEAFRQQTAWLRDDHAAWRPRREAAASEERYLRDLDLWQQAGRTLEETIQKLWKYTERLARYEGRALSDLQAAGLTVLRVAGRFLHPASPSDRDIMNFLNGEAGTNPRGGTYVITQGGDPRAERYIAGQLLAPGTGLERLYVAPRLISRDTLWERGGIGCRVKAEGEIVGLEAP